MSASSVLPPPSICVVDSNCIIKLKQLNLEYQWTWLVQLGELVDAGYLAYPKHVPNEIIQQRHPDAPGIWMAHRRHACRYPQPSDDTMAEVLGGLGPDGQKLIDIDAPGDLADVYVVAMTYELQHRYPDCRVLLATDDVTDKRGRISPATAASRLGLAHATFAEFLAWANTAAEELRATS